MGRQQRLIVRNRFLVPTLAEERVGNEPMQVGVVRNFLQELLELRGRLGQLALRIEGAADQLFGADRVGVRGEVADELPQLRDRFVELMKRVELGAQTEAGGW